MPYAPSRANLIQYGKESVMGTLVPATAKWRGLARDIEDTRVWRDVPENLGLAGVTFRRYIASLGGRLPMQASPFTFEQSPHGLAASIGQVGATGSTPAYLRTYSLPVANTPNTIDTYSLEGGNAIISGDAAAMPGSFVDDFTLSGKAGRDGEAWMFQPNWVGQKLVPQVFTDALSAPSVEDAIFNNTTIAIDEPGGTMGATTKAGVLMAASIKVKSGWIGVPTADASLFYTRLKYTVPDDQVTFDITFELEDTLGLVAAERAKMNAGTVRLIQFHTTGSTANKDLLISMAALWTKFDAYGDQDGDVMVKASGRALISGSNYFSIAVKNGLAALP